MADTKITALAAIATVDPAADVLPIVDISDTSMAASGTTKKVTTNQILQAGGTATLASATITGDLTVRTNKLKVDATGVGIGTASPSSGTLNINSHFILLGDSQTKIGDNGLVNGVSSDGNSQIQFFGGKSLFFNEGASNTKMTLNSTGLGVGGIVTGTGPTILVEGTAGTYAKFNSKVGAKTWSAGYRSGTLQYEIQEDATERFVIANGGNVGIGVTPSAWANNTALQLKSSASSISGAIYQGANGGNNANGIAYNCYFDSTNWQYVYGSAHPASRYQQSQGVHSWHVAGSSTGVVAFTQAMTLDVSGNLIVGSTGANGLRSSFYSASDGAPVTSGTTQTYGSLRIGAVTTSGALDFGTYAGAYQWIQSVSTSNLATNYNLALNPNGGNVLVGVPATPPTLAVNSQMVFNLTSNTNLRISVRGTDGTTRTANITLA